MIPKIIKRDGAQVEFNPSNIMRVSMASGLTQDEAKSLVGKIQTWLESLGKETVTSLEIRDKMKVELRLISETAADLYSWYQQTKEI